MQSSSYAYVNGRFVPESEATVSISDPGFLYGHGIFETLRVYGGEIFRAQDHIERLLAGLRALSIESVFSREELRAVCRVLIEKNRIIEGVARVYRTCDSTVVTVRSGSLEQRELTAIISTV